MEWESQKYRSHLQPPPLALRFLPHACSRPGVPFMNPNVAAALGGGLGKKPDDDDDDDD